MSITDELRERIDDEALPLSTRRELWNIADRIDAEHEETIQQVLMGEGGVPATDENMAEHGWVRLPKGADGEYIHAGDVLDGYGKTIEVVELRHGRSGWLLISRDGNGYDDTFAFTHHHEPTVEDVLREFAEKIIDSQIPSMHPTYEEAIAEYADKLRLAGDAE